MKWCNWRNRQVIWDTYLEIGVLEAIRLTILKDFADYLSMCLACSDPARSMLEIGKGYVRYMTEHKEYYDFMFCSELMLEVSYEGDVKKLP